MLAPVDGQDKPGHDIMYRVQKKSSCPDLIRASTQSPVRAVIFRQRKFFPACYSFSAANAFSSTMLPGNGWIGKVTLTGGGQPVFRQLTL